MSENGIGWHGEDRSALAPADPLRWLPGTSLAIGADGAAGMELEPLAESGIRWIELAWRNHVFNLLEPDNQRLIGDLVSKAKRLGIAVWSLHLPYGPEWDVSTPDAGRRQAVVARHVQLLELAQRWGIGMAVLHPSWEPIQPEERGVRLTACRHGLAELAEEAERLCVRIAVECLPRTCLGNTSVEIRDLISAHERLGVCVDVNHLLQEAPEQFIRELGSRIVTVHMSDNDGTDERHWLPGQGIIRWQDVIAALAAQGYGGPFMFEARPVTPTQLAACWQALLDGYRERQQER